MIGSLIGTVADRHRNIDLSSDYFTTTWDASSGSIALPVFMGTAYDFDYRIDGGAWTNYNQTPTTNHELVISGLSGNVILDINPINNGLTTWKFNNGGDKLKILSVDNWGVNEISDTKWISAFYGCTNMQITALDYPKFINNANLTNFFRKCNNLTTLNLSNWDVSNMVNLNAFMQDCTGITSLVLDNWNLSICISLQNTFRGVLNLTSLSILNWDVSNITNFNSTFRFCSSLTNLDVSNWNVSNATILNGFIEGTSFTTPVYDTTLINWSALTLNSGVVFHAGNSQYTLGGAAESARNTLTNAPNNWVITDGGGV